MGIERDLVECGPAVEAARDLSNSARGSGDIGVLARAVEELDERLARLENAIGGLAAILEVASGTMDAGTSS
jgi:uroporphyrinogen-III decarboxylase